MTTAFGPHRFLKDITHAVNSSFDEIIKQAKATADVNFSVSLYVRTEAQTPLTVKLMNEGFRQVTFTSDQRDGNYVNVYGNPYAKQIAASLTSKFIDNINAKLEKADMSGGHVSISINVPYELHNEVRAAFIAAGWSRVEFDSTQRDGSWINFFL